jgi:hypothetical protein
LNSLNLPPAWVQSATPVEKMSRRQRDRGEQNDRLLLWVRCFVGLIDNEGFYPGKFLLKPRDEIVRPMFKENDKTEGKKQEQGDPKQAAQQRHARDSNLGALGGQSSSNLNGSRA